MNYPSEDRPDPAEQPIRARVPDHVSGGAFSTGVIVMTANSEFVLDFVQNLGRPHQIVARVVMPHHVLPQLVDALHRNIELYRSRWGDLPTTGPAVVQGQQPTTNAPGGSGGHMDAGQLGTPGQVGAGQPVQPGNLGATQTPGGATGGAAGGGVGPAAMPPGDPNAQTPPAQSPPSSDAGSGVRQASAQEIYDDLKIKDEFLSGAYANAVMIGHGPHEFSFDFITNFYPHSAVSSRVFLAAGQIPRLFDSLKGTWDQLRARMQPPNTPQAGTMPPGTQPPGTPDMQPPGQTPNDPNFGDPNFGDPNAGDGNDWESGENRPGDSV